MALIREFNAHWNSLSPGNKVAAGLIALNVGVFLLWRIPALEPFMVRFFCSNPASGAPLWSMVGATFSHYSFFHLAVNMYVLWSFSNIIGRVLGKEQFLGVYMTAGMVSSLFSYAAKTIRPSLIPSLGASGAIMAILGATCIAFPDSRLSIAFIGDLVPHSFSADSAMKFLIAFDTIGLLLGWKYFDHAAHLGGMLFGIWYMKYGNKIIWRKRESFLRHWHEIRGKPR
ncbi:presenilin-associated rhomboid-like protein, mitochondrial isoform X2 [Lineus longissimus]|uniref:presenilin-associated rhomboid-like protein, mitochondrial isoform X2 n=1 Tax=Lineus longissimus TaxID=88925 RepID=UPI00315CC2D9